MKSKSLVAAAMLVSMTIGTTSFAQGGDSDRRGEGFRQDQGQRDGRQDRRDHQGQRVQQHPGWANGHAKHDERGAGPDHQFYRGDRLPPQYRGRIYVVNDWRGHRLSAPPRGYHWVQTGSDYVLVAIATGVILQLLLTH